MDSNFNFDEQSRNFTVALWFNIFISKTRFIIVKYSIQKQNEILQVSASFVNISNNIRKRRQYISCLCVNYLLSVNIMK